MPVVRHNMIKSVYTCLSFTTMSSLSLEMLSLRLYAPGYVDYVWFFRGNVD